MNYLELVREVARQSGTIPEPATIASLVGLVGRPASIAGWVASANRAICNAKAEWLFLQGEFEGDTLASIRRYTALTWNIERFASWRVQDQNDDTVTCYDLDLGPADEGVLRFLPWDEFYTSQLRGNSAPGRPVWFSISPLGEMVFSPVPDKPYRIRGLYRRKVRELAANTDTPEIPERFHDAIVYRALMFLADFDEAVFQRGQWELEYRRIYSDMQRDCLPVIRITAEPIA